MAKDEAKASGLARSAKARLKGKEAATARSLVDRFLAAAVGEDLAELTGEALAGLADAAARTLDAKRLPAVLVEEAEGALNIACAITDRAFVTDTVLSAIGARLNVDAVFHPVVDHGGRAVSLVAVRAEAAPESVRQGIAAELKAALRDVARVTDDWKPMLSRLEGAIETLRETPPPVPADDLAEVVQFLQWVHDGSFTLMGVRDHRWRDGRLEPVEKSGLGLLRDDTAKALTIDGDEPAPAVRAFLEGPDPLVVTKADLDTVVHRRARLDLIILKRFGEDGSVTGEMRVVGLFTSGVYNRSVTTIPILRRLARAVLERVGADPASHLGKNVAHILETWPRDDLFTMDADELTGAVLAAARLEERARVRLLAHADRFARFVSALVYIPRDRYQTRARMAVGDLLAQACGGEVVSFTPAFLENGMVRVHFIVTLGEGTDGIDTAAVERAIDAATRSWRDDLKARSARAARHDWPAAYTERHDAARAEADTPFLEEAADGHIAIDFHPMPGTEDGRVGLRLFHAGGAVPLSRRVPVLENMGFHVIEESTYAVRRADGATVHLHAMDVRPARAGVAAGTDEAALAPLEETLRAVWQGRADDDRFNALVLEAGVDWRQASVFRAYARYLRQLRSGFTIRSMADALGTHPSIARMLADLFAARFDPAVKKRGEREETIGADIVSALEDVRSSDEDRILRNFTDAVRATLRTNAFADVMAREASDDVPTPVLALKFDPSRLSIVPKPVPWREVFVSSPQVEGTHLRFGPVARGGLRWSDRAQDYRTEVLGLVKAQQVKNAVIVPVGAKGGFYPKRLPDRTADRDAWFQAGRAAYQVFVTSLLSLADDLEEGRVVPPAGVVRHDGDDPYFVVAADKGTATFSDTANAISKGFGFWMDDAFASGGSAGYDHKAMGITARGAWEAVRRHFYEMGRTDENGERAAWDIQETPFTAAGVGDMSGDVFGNGMLLSDRTRLVAAFDHRHIFLDPDPDPAASFAERKRLFDMPRSSWDDYDDALLSKGGGVYPRSAKSIEVSRQAAEALGCAPGAMTPQELMRTILQAPVDLFWFGGIGTYVRATDESDADVGDRSNDAIRIAAPQLRASVVGEGANLGMTQRARIEYGLRGGRANSDAIDNSGGVNSSDVEVNIKIALAEALRSGRLTRPKRDALLKRMTDDVAELVLDNNRSQTLAISVEHAKGMDALPHQRRLMQVLEAQAGLDRAVEDLPDESALDARRAAEQPLTRSEIGVLLAHAKIATLAELVKGDAVDDPAMEVWLTNYFPKAMRKTYADEIGGHRLRREIIATELTNAMIDRAGPTFLTRMGDRTGAGADRLARAFMAARALLDLPAFTSDVAGLDGQVPGDVQVALHRTAQEALETAVRLTAASPDRFAEGVGPVMQNMKEFAGAVSGKLMKAAPDFVAGQARERAERFVDAGVPDRLAERAGRMGLVALVPAMADAAARTGAAPDAAMEAHFAVTHAFRLGRLGELARAVTTSDRFDALALDQALGRVEAVRGRITQGVLEAGGMDAWLERRGERAARVRAQLAAITHDGKPSVSRLTVAAATLAELG